MSHCKKNFHLLSSKFIQKSSAATSMKTEFDNNYHIQLS